MSSSPSPRSSIYSVSYSQVEPKPRAAAYLVAIGGAFVFVEGLLLGEIWVLLVGFFLFVVAALIHGEPHHHLANGMLALLLAFLSWVLGFGGFYIGALLAAIGGIIAIVWSPPKPFFQTAVAPKRAQT